MGRVLVMLALLVGLLSPSELLARCADAGATIEGAVSTQSTIPLPGVLVELRDQNNRVVGRQISDGQGQVRFTGVARGSYHLVASLEGFQTTDHPATATPGQTATVAIDLPIAVIGERVEVVAAPVAAETIGTTDAISSTTVEQYGGVAGLQAALRLLASVITVP